MMKPKILGFDIETLPSLVMVWGLKQNGWIDPSNIVQETSICCVSWKWVGEKKVRSVSILDNESKMRTSVYDDSHVINTFYRVMEEADLYLYQNGDRFDLPMLHARFLKHGLPPLPPKDNPIDTLKQSKKIARLLSHKLDYMGQYLLGEGKIRMGFGNWTDIVQWDYPQLGKDPCWDTAKKAVTKMVKYNKQDVRLCEKVYLKLRPHMKNHPNVRMYVGKRDICPTCGSTNVIAIGTRIRLNGRYQRWFCKDCPRYFQSTLSVGRDHVRTS